MHEHNVCVAVVKICCVFMRMCEKDDEAIMKCFSVNDENLILSIRFIHKIRRERQKEIDVK